MKFWLPEVGSGRRVFLTQLVFRWPGCVSLSRVALPLPLRLPRCFSRFLHIIIRLPVWPHLLPYPAPRFPQLRLLPQRTPQVTRALFIASHPSTPDAHQSLCYTEGRKRRAQNLHLQFSCICVCYLAPLLCAAGCSPYHEYQLLDCEPDSVPPHYPPTACAVRAQRQQRLIISVISGAGYCSNNGDLPWSRANADRCYHPVRSLSIRSATTSTTPPVGKGTPVNSIWLSVCLGRKRGWHATMDRWQELEC